MTFGLWAGSDYKRASSWAYSAEKPNDPAHKKVCSWANKERLRYLRNKRDSTDIRFTTQKKVDGVWVTTDIPLDIQMMVEDAYKELEPSKEVGPLYHLAQVEQEVLSNIGITTRDPYDPFCICDDCITPQYEVRPQLQDDLARRQEEGYQRLYKAIMSVGDEKNYECTTTYCTCDSWQERAECNLWQEEQVQNKTHDEGFYRLTHEEKLACKNETGPCDGWPFCECDEYEPITVERTYSIFDCPGGKPVEIHPTDETILQEAQRLVHSDRGSDYGHPLDDMSRTALIWQGILGIAVTAEQVALCMVGVKISRECNKSKRDNLTDIAGYAECLSMIHEERKRRGG